MRIFFDTNVLLDVLLFRTPHAEHSAKVLSLCAAGGAYGIFSVLSACNMVYILRRNGLSEAAAKSKVLELAMTIGMADVDSASVKDALRGDSSDFEDSVQALCAVNNRANVIVTRDKTGFVSAKIPVLTPTEFLDREIDDTEI